MEVCHTPVCSGLPLTSKDVRALVSKYTDFPQFSKPREICCKNKTSHKGSNEDPSHGAHSEIQQGPQLLAWSLLSNA